MKNVIILLLLLIGKNLVAQIPIYKAQNVYKNLKGETIFEKEFRRGRSSYKVSYKGSIYLKDTFEVANITLKGGKQIAALICFDKYKNEVLALINSEIYPVTDAAEFILGEYHFIKIKNEFYQVILEKENLKLLKLYKTDLIEDNSTNMSNSNTLAITNSKNTTGDVYLGEFVTKNVSFFQFDDGKIFSFDLKKKSIVSALEKGDSELGVKFKDSDVDFTKIENVITILK